MPLILNGLTPLHWALSGVGIAGVTLALLLIASRRLGISTGFDDVCSLVMRVPYFRRSAVTAGRAWRLPLLGGLLLGGSWSPTWELGIFDERIGLGPAGKIAWMFVGGLFIGAGTRLGGGCTSGHGIFGLSNFEMPSAIATASFMAAGIVTTHIVYRVLFPLAAVP